MKGLDKQMIKQSQVICSLCRELLINSNIASDNKSSANRDTISNNRETTKINIYDTKTSWNNIFKNLLLTRNHQKKTPRTNI